MNFFENILGAPAARRYSPFLIPYAEAQEAGTTFRGCLPGAPQDFAGIGRTERKEQASCLRSQEFYRRAAGAPFLKLYVSVPLREVISKVFSTQFSVFKELTRKVLRGAQVLVKNSLLCVSAPLREIKKQRTILQSFRITYNVLRNTLHDYLPQVPNPQNLVPNEQTEFAS